MKKRLLILGMLLGALTSVPVIALLYLGNALFGLPFAPFDLLDWSARALPGDVVTFGIDTIVESIRLLGVVPVSEAAKPVELALALLTFVMLGAVLGLGVAWLYKPGTRVGKSAGPAAALLLFGLLLVAEVSLGQAGPVGILWLLLVIVGWGMVLQWLLAALVEQAEETGVDAGRRDLLLKVAGGSLGVALGAWGLGRVLGGSREEALADTGASQPLPTVEATRALPEASASITATATPNLENRIEPVPGTRQEVTPTDDFYRIDINTRSPVIDGEAWQLEVAGLFSSPRNLTIEDLMAYPAVTQALTLSCISNRIAGDLIGTTYWTGVRLRDVLADLQLQPEAGALLLEAEDGFYETVVAEDMMDDRTLLVYGMNGETLQVEHGYPLRIYIPNRYGMKQPKWIVRMEAVEAWVPGYWVERNWSREARPHIVSVIDTVAVDMLTDEGLLPIGGIAWAGDRSIQKVEVQVDEGPWEEAQLRRPPLSTLTWVQWRYDWPASEGSHTFTVRATDGTGMLQIAEEMGVRPDGATGYHSVTRSV